MVNQEPSHTIGLPFALVQKGQWAPTPETFHKGDNHMSGPEAGHTKGPAPPNAAESESLHPVRRVLDQIEAVLMDPDHGKQLWDVLTALRGPDTKPFTQESYELKLRTTAIIRSRAFPRVARNLSTFPHKFAHFSHCTNERIVARTDDPQHFVQHAIAAERALDWVNQEV